MIADGVALTPEFITQQVTLGLPTDIDLSKSKQLICGGSYDILGSSASYY